MTRGRYAHKRRSMFKIVFSDGSFEQYGFSPEGALSSFLLKQGGLHHYYHMCDSSDVKIYLMTKEGPIDTSGLPKLEDMRHVVIKKTGMKRKDVEGLRYEKLLDLYRNPGNEDPRDTHVRRTTSREDQEPVTYETALDTLAYMEAKRRFEDLGDSKRSRYENFDQFRNEVHEALKSEDPAVVWKRFLRYHNPITPEKDSLF